MMQVGTNQSATYHSQPALSTTGGQAGRSSSNSRQQPQQSQYDTDQLANIRPRLCVLRKWPHYDGYGVHLARNQHWLGLRIGDVEPNSPAESGGLLREDVVLAVNGHSVENDDFFVILSFIQHELEGDQIRFLVLDPHSADLARRHNLNIDENYRGCVRMETPTLTVSPEKLLYDQWRTTNASDPAAAQTTINLGPTLSLNQDQASTNAPRYREASPHAGRDDVYTFLPYSDTNNNLGLGPRMCSVTLRPGDSIGISLQQDKDFSHIIKHVEPNSAADYAGIERDDCIISLNDIPLLHVSYQEVLNTLKRYRNDPNLDFLVAKKSYLLKSNQNNTAAEVLPSSNIPSTVPPTQALEQLFNKYNNEQKSPYDQTSSSNQVRETVSTSTPNDRLSPQFDNDRYPSKSQQGQILHGVGPATADQSSWGVSSGKSSDEFPLSGDSSIRSTSRDRRPDADESKGRNSSLDGSLKPLQVGITNPAASQQSANTTPNLNNSPQRTSRPTSSDEQRERSPSPNANRGSSRTNETLQHIPAAVPITPGQPSSTKRDYEQGSTQPVPSNQADIQLATTPISQLKEQGYELHNIQLMQPTETSPVGLKLTKQQEPLQYIITAVAKGTKADLAGLRVDDWLIKIDDKDIRLTEFSEVSHEIRQLLTNAGLINLVIARKKSPTSSPAIQQVETQRSPAVSSSSPQTDSFTRQQKSQNAQSLLTTDITRDTPDNNQVRFTADQSQNTTAVRSQRSPAPSRENISNTPGAPLSVGITNPISDENATRSPRSRSTSPSRSPTREFPLNREQKASLTEQPSDVIDPNEIRQIVLKEALGLDFNSFIPEGDSNTQTHFISNVQASSMADKAGLRDGDRILTVNGVDVRNAVHEDVRQMMQSKKPLQLTVVNDPKYLELIESVKRNLPKSEEPASRNRTSPKKSSDETANSSSNIRSKDDLSKNLSTLFTDDKGAVQVKHCLLKKEPNYNGYGLLLRYQNGLHLIDQVEQDSPAYNAGLREDDVILFVDQKNVEQMTHDDVKILIRKLSLSNTNIDLILIRKSDMQRYNTYQQKNTLNWAGIFDHELPAEPRKTDQQQTNNPRPINDPVTVPRQGSTSSSKQPAPAPPSAASEESTRTCILIPSPERTAGFALSGTAPPPYVICQIEKGSPAEKAGLLLNDTLLSINGKSVVDSEYKDTVKLIKEALQQKSVELVVREQSTNKSRAKTNSQSSMPDPRNNSSLGSYDSNNAGNTGSVGPESSTRGANAVEEYQKQRNKELSYSLRLCHLHPTNGDGTQASTFGFELSEEPDYEYPLILRVEPHSSAEGAGLQSRDILLKINDKKTKGLGYEKVKKEIEKAKRDGRLEMLVVDQETFDYCKRTKKPMKEPEMKVKHVFPKTENDVPARTTTSTKGRAPSPPTSRYGSTRLDNPYASQSFDTVNSNTTSVLPASTIQDTVRSTVSTGSFDYLRGPRRCIIRVDRKKGLGFVLSATGDYDHTITDVEKNSAADIAGLQVNDEVLEVDGVDVRNVTHEQVVDMVVSAMRTNESIELRVIEGHARDAYPSTVDSEKQINTNNNNNIVPTSTIHSQRTTAVLSDDLSDINSTVSPFDSINQQKIATSYPNLPGQLRQIDGFTSRALSGSVPALATVGITASPGILHHPKSISVSSEKGSITRLSDISSQDAPVARLCRVRKFATSPFYGFFLCGDPKKLGRVFISDVTKHSPAAVCGLRDGDRIIEVNGTTVHALTYETILDKIKQHMARDDLELLVLDKKSVHWYRERNYPITSRTLPTIVHIEPIINETTSEIQSSEAPSTQTKMVGFADRRVSKTGL